MSRTTGARIASALSTRKSRVRWAVGAISVIALAAGVSVAAPAYAVDYPSWADVQNARANETAKNAQVANIQRLIVSLEAETAAARALSDQRGGEFMAAQGKFDEADQRSQQLEAQATLSQAEADKATTQAGRLAAQLYRSGGSNLSMSLLMEDSSAGADELLSKLGNMSKLVERSSDIYESALVARNEAQSLSDQAEIAVAQREILRAESEVAMQVAIEASVVADAKLAEGETQSLTLNAQLAALQDTTATTVADYEAGVAERARLELIAREQAAAAAAAEAAARGVSVSDAGWAHPVPNAWVSDTYGARTNFYIPGVGWTGSFHNATDLAAWCGSPVYAASSGTVSYAGGASGYGQLLTINHGGGVSSAYGHLQTGGFAVSTGQWVTVGQLVARVGRTGLSTGCHTHFEIRIGYGTTNPQPFMSDRGVRL
jgi:murein DD-endopeptidase MepM/ murein hydrolase activator NlpD